jgi:aconitase A
VLISLKTLPDATSIATNRSTTLSINKTIKIFYKMRRFATATRSFTPPYERWVERLAHVRAQWPLSHGTPALTLTDKILAAHLAPSAPLSSLLPSSVDQLKLHPDRVAMQDASAQMALLQFMTCGKPEAALPVSVHCDHLIRASIGADADVEESERTEHEIYTFLESCAKRYGMAFWRPGSGIIHQIVLENYAFPGGLMLGTDSHTPNAGGLGMMAIGVGGADAVDAMVGLPWEVKRPRVLGIHLTGTLSPWASPKGASIFLCQCAY